MPAESPRSSRPAWLLPVAVVAVAAILVALILAMNRDGDTGATGELDPSGEGAPTEVDGPAQPDFSEAERRDESDLLAIGPVDAPVVLVVFSDYQCPFCAKWSEETMPLMTEHVEAGDLRIEWRDVNVFGPASERAARASYAAAEQGAFWEYHDELFAGGDTRSEGDLSEDALIALADELGLDTDQFTADLASEQTAQQIADNQQLGLDIGAYSTPAFILGGQPIVGAQPSQVFVDAFDDALSAAE
ncbi:DsbA family protein [Brevibacterium casei]|uniref:Thioredoxin domain-containing protein n=1 Tax=Brevibacterium casei TaxID=33889 RepID=A0A7T2TGW2_9MICO|nr:thioredoxin domain-containing protein [Brevibacterium casei]QPS33667.1 thioredoxin domain-containing protein [Brevibacterium casei]